jgi:molecular chaperone DnaJ
MRRVRKKVVAVPAGVDNGNQIRLAGEGQPGENGGPNGNLYLVIRVLTHKFFRRRENDIMLDLNINIAQAILGAEVEVPTVDGPAQLKIPAGIQPGKVLRMRGKGVPHVRGNGRGDQMVIVNVEVPKNLTSEQRKLMEQLAVSLGSNVRPAERGFLEWLKETLGG